MTQATGKARLLTTRNVVKIGLLAAVSYVLMFFELRLPIFPEFLKIDVSDVPAIIGAMAMGPAVGVLVELIKNLLHLVIQTSTGGVGELANFIVGGTYAFVIGVLYRRWGKYALSSIAATLAMTLVACLVNYFFLIPAYAAIFGMPIDAFVGIAQKTNGFITDFRTLILFGIAPFNLLKCVLLAVASYALYIPLKPALARM